MRLAKTILLAALSVALAAYALDCGAMTTAEQAMQCCNSMPCTSPGHHGQDCCQTMAAMHSPFVQPSNAHGNSLAPVVFAVLAAPVERHGLDSAARIFAAHGHAPPLFYAATSPPLRI